MKKKGLSFYKRRRAIQTSAVQEVIIHLGVCVLAFVIGCVLVYYFMTSLTCVGQAMEPTVGSGDQVFVNRFIYSLSAPKDGDVVVFKPKGNDNTHYYIKRIIGLPGETIEVIENSVYINGKKLEEEYDTTRIDNVGVLSEKMKLKEDEFFVLGDDRENSEDSRSADVGNIKRAYIYGRAWFVLYPGKNFGLVR